MTNRLFAMAPSMLLIEAVGFPTITWDDLPALIVFVVFWATVIYSAFALQNNQDTKLEKEVPRTLPQNSWSTVPGGARFRDMPFAGQCLWHLWQHTRLRPLFIKSASGCRVWMFSANKLNQTSLSAVILYNSERFPRGKVQRHSGGKASCQNPDDPACAIPKPPELNKCLLNVLEQHWCVRYVEYEDNVVSIVGMPYPCRVQDYLPFAAAVEDVLNAVETSLEQG